MPKLPKEYRFTDFSDYGRLPAYWIASLCKHTRVTPIHLTTLFVICGVLAIYSILNDYRVIAAALLILKSILDAADGELSRLKKTPSFTGRYYDSIADIILNFFFLWSFCVITSGSIYWMLLAFICIQLQGTLYNYYYIILRNRVEGDTTSRVFESKPPTAMPGESQWMVTWLFRVYFFLYAAFDKTIHFLDKSAVSADPFPRWFMSLASFFGLGFQLLIMAVLFLIGLEAYIIPLFVYLTLLIPVFIVVRRML